MYLIVVFGIWMKSVQSFFKKKNTTQKQNKTKKTAQYLDNEYSLHKFKIERGLEDLPWVTAFCPIAALESCISS